MNVEVFGCECILVLNSKRLLISMSYFFCVIRACDIAHKKMQKKIQRNLENLCRVEER